MITYDDIDVIIAEIENHVCEIDDKGHNICINVSHDSSACAYNIALHIKYWLQDRVLGETGKLDCGCNATEFGCQGYHGT